MKTKLFFTAFLVFIIIGAKAQTDDLIIGKDIRLPKDSTVQINLLNSLNKFLYSVKENRGIDAWILPEEKAETQLLIDEIQEFVIGDTIGIKPYLINSELLNDKNSFSIQIAYLSQNDSQPLLKAIIEFIVYEKSGKFLFASPLLRNTKEWKIKIDGHLTFHYQNVIAEKMIDQYIRIAAGYDKKLGVNKASEYYFSDNCQSLTDLMRLAGIHYKLDYNGYAWPMIDFYMEDKRIALYGQKWSRNDFVDPHDVFHSRASVAIPSAMQNHSMICGTAYVYGGSWGMSWNDIKKMFKERMIYDKKTDWLKLYFERYNFGKSQEEHLLITQFINALLVEKIEKEQGFSAVMKLLSSGNIYTERERFFRILEEVTGVNEANFNRKVGVVIEDALKGVLL